MNLFHSLRFYIYIICHRGIEIPRENIINLPKQRESSSNEENDDVSLESSEDSDKRPKDIEGASYPPINNHGDGDGNGHSPQEGDYSMLPGYNKPYHSRKSASHPTNRNEQFSDPKGGEQSQYNKVPYYNERPENAQYPGGGKNAKQAHEPQANINYEEMDDIFIECNCKTYRGILIGNCRCEKNDGRI